MIAAALVPLLALVGGAIDMGRSYLSQTRLQQACDAGVLAARKKLGPGFVGTALPAEVVQIGNRFFGFNFPAGSYGTANRTFEMALNGTLGINAVAKVQVPTTIMAVFGYSKVDVATSCSANLNLRNTDIMLVLDSSGTMGDTNSGDTKPRIEVLRDVVARFHQRIQAARFPGSRVRFGFVPYTENVNVGGLLKPEWMVDRWNYHGRVLHETGQTITGSLVDETWTYISGQEKSSAGYGTLPCPANTVTQTNTANWTDAAGIEHSEYVLNGDRYRCLNGYKDYSKTSKISYVNFKYRLSRQTKTNQTIPARTWRYQLLQDVDVSSLKDPGSGTMRVGSAIHFPFMGGTPYAPKMRTAFFRGCIEERQTYEIEANGELDLSRALDLDVDLIPDPANPATQWRPILDEVSYVRGVKTDQSGTPSIAPVDYSGNFYTHIENGMMPCPAPAQKLREMTSAEVVAYLNTIFPLNGTYHDIGMIWGTRLLSPTGLFAAENADIDEWPTNRHLIFLTDGRTQPIDLAYATYGIEALDQRRWTPSSPLTMVQAVEQRFLLACGEAKKRNISVWFVSFGLSMNPIFTKCAGPGQAFAAMNATELENAFVQIATRLGDLRLVK